MVSGVEIRNHTLKFESQCRELCGVACNFSRAICHIFRALNSDANALKNLINSVRKRVQPAKLLLKQSRTLFA